MRRPLARTLLAATGTLAAVGMAAAPASATDTGVLGVADVVGTASGVVFTGHCQYEFAAAGVGGGGATYVVEAVGTATSAAVRDAQVICTVNKPDGSHTVASQFLPGDAAAAAGTFRSASLAAGSTCVEVKAFLSSGATVHSAVSCGA